MSASEQTLLTLSELSHELANMADPPIRSVSARTLFMWSKKKPELRIKVVSGVRRSCVAWVREFVDASPDGD